MATGHLAIRLVNIDLRSLHEGGGLPPAPSPIAWGKGIKNHLYARGDSFLIWGFTGGLGGFLEGWEASVHKLQIPNAAVGSELKL